VFKLSLLRFLHSHYSFETNKVSHVFNMSQGEEYSQVYDLQETQPCTFEVESPAVSLIPIAIYNVRFESAVNNSFFLFFIQRYTYEK